MLIETDSKYAMNGVTKYLKRYEDQGYIGVANKPILKKTVASMRMRQGTISIKWVKGHNGHLRNEGADRMAAIGAAKDRPDEVDLKIPAKFWITGAKLSALTQSLAYKAIREQKTARLEPRRRTQENLAMIKQSSRDELKRIPTSNRIWLSLKSKDFSREARYFLWMTTHDAYMVGSKWLRENFSDDLRERSKCKYCDREDSMEYILTECNAPGQQIVWNMARDLWEHKNPEWPSPSLGVILACGTAVFKNDKTDKPKAGDARLYRIIISESSKLIWNLRNERVIQKDGQNFSQQEIQNRWKTAIENRLQLDRRASNPAKYGKKATKAHIVANTWSKVIENEDNLPKDWVQKVGVLVGIRPYRQRLGRGEG
ncbi:hypothetical protein BXZ70DRAFT_902758 [Cristinia sonorae]|uniref:RNase H type-1 domain-containing protein n=1 Tax=Cristinia sonorae TaxID=1940300 RepID=A0A8K0UCX4_9AGAR|nr:hypothetical protein BXZ70DRAFT_902758 [Cristinia sonorae]